MAMPTRPRESGFKTNPDYRITFEASPRRVRVRFNGEIIADSTNAHLLFETRHLPVYYFPRSDLRIDRMTPTDHHTFCPYKATASYWNMRITVPMIHTRLVSPPQSAMVLQIRRVFCFVPLPVGCQPIRRFRTMSNTANACAQL